mgnify:CR=1 FL=1
MPLRKGGPFYIPLNLNAVVQALLPGMPPTKEAAFLAANGYPLTTAMELALTKPVKLSCAPAAAWVGAGEPVLTVTGPSFLVSWLEPLLIMLHYPIQVATAMKGDVLKRKFTFTSSDEARIIHIINAAVLAGTGIDVPVLELTRDEGYQDRVARNILDAVFALNGEAHRAFEVGLRSATCMAQHLRVLEVCNRLGIRKTSNVFGAWKNYMVPVGTTGHEHQMRWSAGQTERNLDLPGFQAIRDMRPEPPSYLFDTFDPLKLGIPAAMRAISEAPERPCTLRFDSGDQNLQYEAIRNSCNVSATAPTLVFEDGYTADKTAKNEVFCHLWPKEKRLYGYGGFFVADPSSTPYVRDAVSAAYKLSSTGGVPVWKCTPGKVSVPGKPVILEQVPLGTTIKHLIAQEGETVEGYSPIVPRASFLPSKVETSFSGGTLRLLNRLDWQKTDFLRSGAGTAG